MSRPQLAPEPGTAPRRERGFALLLVFAMAASVAILIYLEIPRVAFERQRDKEALLIDRGEQYVRAIELYARKMNKYPQTLDELEHAQTVRFLRKRYKDPMTGKDEWRLVHVNANGQYVDSKVHKAAGALDKKDNGPSVLASKIQGVGEAATLISPEGQATSAALQKRASDRISPRTPGTGSADAGQNGAADGSLDAEKDLNLDPDVIQANAAAAAAGQAPAPVGSFNSARFPNAPQAPGTAQQQGNPQDAAASGGLAGAPTFASISPAGQPVASGANPAQGGPTQPPAMQAIQAVLGGQRGATVGVNAPAAQGGQAVGGQAAGAPSSFGAGLVGIATKLEMEGIRRYKDHSNYSEWEFIYDPKDAKGQGQGQSSSAQPGTSSSSSTSAFGGMAGGVPAPSAAQRSN